MPHQPPPAAPGHLRPLFRRFLLMVHPDLFSDSPVISKQNEESLQIVLPFFNSIFSSDSSHTPDARGRSAGHTVLFHVKHSPNTSGSEGASQTGTSTVRYTLFGSSLEAKISSVTKLYVAFCCALLRFTILLIYKPALIPQSDPVRMFSMCESAAKGISASSTSTSSSANSGSDQQNASGWTSSHHDFNSSHSSRSSSSSYTYTPPSSFLSFLRQHAHDAAAARSSCLKLEAQMHAAIRRLQQQYNVRVEWVDASSPSSCSNDLLQERVASLQLLLLHHTPALACISSTYPVVMFSHNKRPPNYM